MIKSIGVLTLTGTSMTTTATFRPRSTQLSARRGVTVTRSAALLD